MGGPLLVNHQPAWRVAGVVSCEAGSADRAERKAGPDLLPHPKRVNPWHPGISAPFAANTDLECRCRRSRGFRLVQAGPRSPRCTPRACRGVRGCAPLCGGGRACWVPVARSSGPKRPAPSRPMGRCLRCRACPAEPSAGRRHHRPQRAVSGNGVTDRLRAQHIEPARLQVVVGLVHRQPRPPGRQRHRAAPRSGRSPGPALTRVTRPAAPAVSSRGLCTKPRRNSWRRRRTQSRPGTWSRIDGSPCSAADTTPQSPGRPPGCPRAGAVRTWAQVPIPTRFG